MDSSHITTCEYYQTIVNYTTNSSLCEEALTFRDTCCNVTVPDFTGIPFPGNFPGIPLPLPPGNNSEVNITSIVNNSTFESNSDNATNIPVSSVFKSVPIQVSFQILNQQGLKAASLKTGIHRGTLDMAFLQLVMEVVVKNQGMLTEQQQSDSMKRLRSRRLTVTLDKETVEVYSVEDSTCVEEDIPSNALCQNVHGHYSLNVPEQNADAASIIYTNTTNDAVNEGALEEIFRSIDPHYPYAVLGAVDPPALTVVTPVEKENLQNDPKQEDPLDWWLVVKVIVSALFGLTLLFAALYIAYDVS